MSRLNKILECANQNGKIKNKDLESISVRAFTVKKGSCDIKIKNNVSAFSKQEHLSIAYLEDEHKLFFFYGEYDVSEYKVKNLTDCITVRFINYELYDYLLKNGKECKQRKGSAFVIKGKYFRDKETRLYYIDLEKEKKNVK